MDLLRPEDPVDFGKSGPQANPGQCTVTSETTPRHTSIRVHATTPSLEKNMESGTEKLCFQTPWCTSTKYRTLSEKHKPQSTARIQLALTANTEQTHSIQERRRRVTRSPDSYEMQYTIRTQGLYTVHHPGPAGTYDT